MDKVIKCDDSLTMRELMWGKTEFQKEVFQNLLDRISYLEEQVENVRPKSILVITLPGFMPYNHARDIQKQLSQDLVDYKVIVFVGLPEDKTSFNLYSVDSAEKLTPELIERLENILKEDKKAEQVFEEPNTPQKMKNNSLDYQLVK